jgi:hypothetical protein
VRRAGAFGIRYTLLILATVEVVPLLLSHLSGDYPPVAAPSERPKFAGAAPPLQKVLLAVFCHQAGRAARRQSGLSVDRITPLGIITYR